MAGVGQSLHIKASVTNPIHIWMLTYRRFADAALQLPH